MCVPRFPKNWTQSSCLTTLKQFYLHYRHIKHLDPDPKGIWIHAYWYAVQEINKKTVYSKTPCRDALGTVYRVPVVKSQPHVVPEQGRHADGEEDGDKEEEDDMIFGRP